MKGFSFSLSFKWKTFSKKRQYPSEVLQAILPWSRWMRESCGRMGHGFSRDISPDKFYVEQGWERRQDCRGNLKAIGRVHPTIKSLLQKLRCLLPCITSSSSSSSTPLVFTVSVFVDTIIFFSVGVAPFTEPPSEASLMERASMTALFQDSQLSPFFMLEVYFIRPLSKIPSSSFSYFFYLCKNRNRLQLLVRWELFCKHVWGALRKLELVFFTFFTFKLPVSGARSQIKE